MPDVRTEPPILLVMGVSGSGKTTIGSLLAGRLGWDYAEADSFHSAANIARMAAGHPLSDEDRWPWLAAIGDWIDKTTAHGRPGVVTCSALKRSYRDVLRAGRPQVRLIYLDADPATTGDRLTARNGHFFPAELLASQFRDLEPPADDENVVRVSTSDQPAVIVDELIEAEGLEVFVDPRRGAARRPRSERTTVPGGEGLALQPDQAESDQAEPDQAEPDQAESDHAESGQVGEPGADVPSGSQPALRADWTEVFTPRDPGPESPVGPEPRTATDGNATADRGAHHTPTATAPAQPPTDTPPTEGTSA